MSGNTVSNNPRALFDRMISEKSSAFVLKENGELESSGKMSFRSGLHRMFGQEKSTDDIKSNKDTMKFVLQHVANHVTDSEMKEIMDGKIRLGGEKDGYTVRERLERGTYVSSDLIKQLRLVVQDVHTRHEMARLENEAKKPEVGVQNLQQDGGEIDSSPPKPEEVKDEQVGVMEPSTLMTQQEKDRVGRLNRSGVDHAFGGARHPQANSGIEHQWRQGGTVVDRALTKFGTEEKEGGKPTTFQKAISDLYTEGTSGEHPQTEVWNTFRNFWTKEWSSENEWSKDLPPEDQERHDLISQFRQVVEDKAQELNDRGIVMSQDDIKAVLKDCLASPQQMDKFENLTKTEIEHEEAEIALQVAGEIKGSNEKTVRDIGPQGLSEAIQHWIKANPRFEGQGKAMLEELGHAGELTEKLGLTPLETDWTAKMIGQDGGTGHPMQLTQQLREALQGAYDANPSRTHLTSEDVSKLLGDTLSRIAGERETGKPAPEVEAKLHEDLEDMYPTLGDMRGPQGITGSTVAGVAGGLLYQRMGEILLERGIEKAKSEGKDLSLPEVQNEITQGVRQTLTQHRETQARLLPVLDQHVSIRDEIKSLTGGDGGLPGTPKEKLRELDLRYDSITRQSEELDAYCKQLKEEFGDDVDLGNILESLTDGTTGILLESMNYTGESSRTDREYVAKVEQQLGTLPLEVAVRPDIPGVSPGLSRTVARLPGLRDYVLDLSQRTPTFNSIGSLSDLVGRTVWQQSRARIEKEVRDNNTFFVDSKVEKELLKFEDEWTKSIGTKLSYLEGDLDDLGSLPPPPKAPMTVESIEEYRQSLTNYIEVGGTLGRRLDEIGGGFEELHGLGLIGNLTLSNAMYSSMDIVNGHVKVAQRALEALQR